jgi:hypothetical protein
MSASNVASNASDVASLLHAILHPRSDGGAERGCCRGRGVTHRGSKPICDGLLGTRHQWRKFLANSNVSIASRVWAGSRGLVQHLRSARTHWARITVPLRLRAGTRRCIQSSDPIARLPSDTPMVAFVLRTSSINSSTHNHASPPFFELPEKATRLLNSTCPSPLREQQMPDRAAAIPFIQNGAPVRHAMPSCGRASPRRLSNSTCGIPCSGQDTFLPLVQEPFAAHREDAHLLSITFYLASRLEPKLGRSLQMSTAMAASCFDAWWVNTLTGAQTLESNNP